MKRTHAVLLLALVAAVAIPGLAVAQEADVTISSVSVSPDQPVPGDNVRVEAVVENFESSGRSYFIDRVALVDAGDESEEYADVSDIGALAPGSSRTVPLTTTFDEAGTYDLSVRVWGRFDTTGDQIQLQYPLRLTVTDDRPQVDVDVDGGTAGVRSSGSVTIANGLEGNVTDVELSIDGENVAITNEREVIATLGGGESTTVDFQYRPESPGEFTVNATLTYTTDGGTTDTVSETVTLTADDHHPQLAIQVNESIEAVESKGTVTVANGIGTNLTNVELTVDGNNVSVRDDRTVFTSIGQGESGEGTFWFRPESPGRHILNATLTYSAGDGPTRTITQPVAVTAEPLNDQVVLDLSTREGGDDQTLTVDVLNQGNAPVTNVTVVADSANASVRQALIDRVPPGESRTVALNASLDGQQADIDVTANYDVGNRNGRATATTSLSRAPGVIGLTGVTVSEQGGRVQISGSASNLGTTQAQGVVVSVKDVEGVEPADPNPEYFVGNVPASDFVSFDVYADVDRNVSTIPLEVSYLVDEERTTRTVEVDAPERAPSSAAQDGSQPESGNEDGNGGEPNTSGSGGGTLLPVAVGLVVALAVIGIIVRAWRNSRGGD